MPMAKPAPSQPRTDVSGKIKGLTELAAIIQSARRRGRKIVLCHGVFDLVHPGHIVHFKEARKHGDLLVVTVTPDRWVNKGPGHPLFSEQLRLESLAALAMVDYVALNEWPTATKAIKLLRPHFYVKGRDYADPKADLTGKIGEEAAAIKSVGGRLVTTEGFTSSSSHIINRFFSAYPAETQEYLDGMRRLHSADSIIAHLRSLSKLKVLVIGEAILDQYSYCLPLGKSPKENLVSTKYSHEELFAGGAVATANHLAGFCQSVVLLTNLGPDAKEEAFIRGKLRPNVRLEAVRTPERPTVRKQRFVDPEPLRKVFEIQYLDDTPLDTRTEKACQAKLARELPRHDLVVVNDFGHGLMTPRLRETVLSSRKFLALNTQSNSANHGFNAVTKYAHADYVAIDELELRIAARDKYGAIPDLAASVRRQLRAGQFLVSRGALGSFVLSSCGWHESPALALRIVDRMGAGDALFAVTSPCAYRRVPPDLLCFIGNCVGALAVEIVGNRKPVDPVALFKFIKTLLK
ncbi:MAG: PfkB family carbohydrate kinase [Elusimicrobia bacterium]|nr:PfkB family carbohydrate kinase [Elusimicrobiota bacterium]